MVKIRWNEEALNDISEIAEYIASDSITYAIIEVETFFERVEILKSNPHIGKIVAELNDEYVRQLVEGNYRIIYEIKNVSTIEILCVIHGRRLLKNHPTFLRKTKARTSG